MASFQPAGIQLCFDVPVTRRDLPAALQHFRQTSKATAVYRRPNFCRAAAVAAESTYDKNLGEPKFRVNANRMVLVRNTLLKSSKGNINAAVPAGWS